MKQITFILSIYFLIVFTGCDNGSKPEENDPIPTATRKVHFIIRNSQTIPLQQAYVSSRVESNANNVVDNKNGHSDASGNYSYFTTVYEGGATVSYTVSKDGFATKSGTENLSFSQGVIIGVTLGEANDEADLIPVSLFINSENGVVNKDYAYYNQKTGEKITEVILPTGMTSDLFNLTIKYEIIKDFDYSTNVKHAVYIDGGEVGSDNYVGKAEVREYRVRDLRLNEGSHTFKQIVDVAGNVKEANEYNNSMEFNFTIKQESD